MPQLKVNMALQEELGLMMEINEFCAEISWALEKIKERMKLEENDLLHKIFLLKSRIPSGQLKSSFYIAKIMNLKEKYHLLNKKRLSFLQKLGQVEDSMKTEGLENLLIPDHSEFVKMTMKEKEQVLKLWGDRERSAQQAKLVLDTVKAEWTIMMSQNVFKIPSN